ncbi:MAG: hypothetical protein JNL25_06095 [Rhodospirillaceae bacterium]|nr:hypothetical protein [Rhodospirillaceae bacterium]
MIRFLTFFSLLFGLSNAAFADVDTLECNRSAAIRVRYMVSPFSDGVRINERPGEFCLLLNGERAAFEVGGVSFTVQYDRNPRVPDAEGSSPTVLGSLRALVVTPGDFDGRVFVAQPMRHRPYNADTDGNWRYSPMWAEFADPIRIIVGEGQAES